MYRMKKAAVRELGYRFREAESRLDRREDILITPRMRAIAKLMPSPHAVPPRLPDFLTRLGGIYKNKRVKATGAELVARERGRY
jgi:hypothetical protein